MTEIAGGPVVVMRRKEGDAIVSPSELSRELRNRHDLQEGYSEFPQTDELTFCCLIGSLWSEGTDVELVDYLIN
jgi:hypothetical protein